MSHQLNLSEIAKGAWTNENHCFLLGCTPTDFLCFPQPGEFLGKKHSFNSVQAFLEEKGSPASLVKMLKNKVKKCKCGKNVAYSLNTCNLCGLDLTETEISYTDNVFTSFIFGIRPFSISLRFQSESFIVFDDLLSLSAVHLNCIPTDKYIPDLRFLLKRPKEGLELICKMKQHCDDVYSEQFLNREEFITQKNYSFAKFDKKIVRTFVASGFNFPPSQYQLHIQYIALPFIPFQFSMYLKGNHFTFGRFIPFVYMEAVLEKMCSTGSVITDIEKPIEVIFKEIEDLTQISYPSVHKEFYDNLLTVHNSLANYQLTSFESIQVGNKNVPISSLAVNEKEQIITLPDVSDLPVVDATAQVNKDKLCLQNYGKPYAADGSFNNTFYGYPKEPTAISDWC